MPSQKKKTPPKKGKTPKKESPVVAGKTDKLSVAPGTGSEKGFYIVGIGASAGGLDAFERFFEGMPKDAGMPIYYFFRSLAQERRDKAICIVLSGMGSDGTLGLSVVHGIVKRHDGDLRVEGELGKATHFEVYFPILKEIVKEEKTPEGKIKGGTERILFVDDEESIVKLNHQRLERLGYQVKSSTKPLETLEWFKADPDQFDVIITDMTMPRMTGDGLIKEILAIRPHLPVIICTGYSDCMSAKIAEGLGVRKYMAKPIGSRNLASALRELLREA
jgi:CheY-like chemotaxis protein